MQTHHGDMWDSYPTAGLFLFTGNSTITRAGKLVMGRGMAKQVLTKFPEIDKTLGKSVVIMSERTPYGLEYNLLVSPHWPRARLGVFQVKYNWKDAADLALITRSGLALAIWAAEHPDCAIHLNCPGIGNGRLSAAEVLPALHGLFDSFPTIHLWTQAPLPILEAL